MSAWTLLLKSGPTLILLGIISLPQAAIAAPLNEETTEMEYYPVADSTGCYYNFQHYDEGDRIITNEPCLNCTCHNRMLMCYLRVCPFTKAIGADCKVEKRPDQCCPVITCPEVPVQLLTSTTQSSTEVGHLDTYGCSIEGLFYSDGARVPSEPNKPCELCYCIRNKTACVMQQCELKIEGCSPVYQEGVCCPVRYNCEHPTYDLLETTTEPKLLTTTTTTTLAPTTIPPGPIDCTFNGETYADGALISKDKPCETCYCMKGDVVCAVQECSPTPLDKVNCTVVPPKEDQCCPDNYICENLTDEEVTTVMYPEAPTTVPSVVPEATTSGEQEVADLTTALPAAEKPKSPEETTDEPAPGVTLTFPSGAESTHKPETGTESTEDHVTLTLPSGAEKESTHKPETGIESTEGGVLHVTEGTIDRTDKPPSHEQVTEYSPEEIPSATEQIHIVDRFPPAQPEQPVVAETEEPLSHETEEPAAPQTEEPAVHLPEEPAVHSTEEPAVHLTEEPTVQLTEEPAVHLTEEPTVHLTEEPAVHLTEEPTVQLTEEPAVHLTEEPAVHLTEEPTVHSTEEPAVHLTEEPTVQLTEEPAVHVTEEPTIQLTEEPVVHLTEEPTVHLTEEPAVHLTEEPTVQLTEEPTVHLTEGPTVQLTEEPTVQLTEEPAVQQTEEPKLQPTEEPKLHETERPTGQETERPEESQETTTESLLTTPSHTPESVIPQETEYPRPGKPEQTVTELPGVPEQVTEKQATELPQTTEEETGVTGEQEVTETAPKSEEGTEPSQKPDKSEHEPESTAQPESATEPGHGTEASKAPEVTKVPDLEEPSKTQEPEMATELPQVPEHAPEIGGSTIATPAEAGTEKEGERSTELPKESPELPHKPEEDAEKESEPGTEQPHHITETTEEKTTELPEKQATEVPLSEIPETTGAPHEGTEIPEGTETPQEGAEIPQEPEAGRDHTTQEPQEPQEPETGATEQPPSEEGKPVVPEVTTQKGLELDTTVEPVEGGATVPSIAPSSTEPAFPGEVTKPEETQPHTEATTDEMPITEGDIITNRVPSIDEESKAPEEITPGPTEAVVEEGTTLEPTKAVTEPSKEHIHTTEAAIEDNEIPSVTSSITKEEEIAPTRLPETVTSSDIETVQPTEIPTEHPEIETEKSAGDILPPTTAPTIEGAETTEPTIEPDHAGDLGGHVPEKGGIPGEGDCLVDGQTYPHNSSVPPINHCQISCKCMSSILQCESVTCSPPPANLHNCMPVYNGPNSCCPTYSCTMPGVTIMESDSHKMETTTTSLVPEATTVDSGKEAATVAEGITTLKPEVESHTEPEQVRTTEKIHEQSTEELPRKPETTEENEIETTERVTEHILSQSESGAPSTSKPIDERKETELPIKPESVTEGKPEVTTEQQAETEPTIIEATTAGGSEATTLKHEGPVEPEAPSVTEPEVQHHTEIPEGSVETEVPSVAEPEAGTKHPSEIPQDITENEIPDHTETVPGQSSHIPEQQTEISEAATTSQGEVQPERHTESAEKEEVPVTTEIVSITERLGEIGTESPEEKPKATTEGLIEETTDVQTEKEHPEGPATESIEYVTEGKKEEPSEESTPEITTEHKEPEVVGVTEKVPEITTQRKETDIGQVTEGVAEVTEPEQSSVTEPQEETTEQVKEHVPEAPFEGATEGTQEGQPERATEAVTEEASEKPKGTRRPEAPEVTESATQHAHVTEAGPETSSEIVTEGIEMTTTKMAEVATQGKDKIEYPIESTTHIEDLGAEQPTTESVKDTMVTEGVKEVTKEELPITGVSEEATVPTVTAPASTEKAIEEPEAVTEVVAETEKAPESISHVTDKSEGVTKPPAEHVTEPIVSDITEKVHQEGQSPETEAPVTEHAPSTEQEKVDIVTPIATIPPSEQPEHIPSTSEEAVTGKPESATVHVTEVAQTEAPEEATTAHVPSSSESELTTAPVTEAPEQPIAEEVTPAVTEQHIPEGTTTLPQEATEQGTTSKSDAAQPHEEPTGTDKESGIVTTTSLPSASSVPEHVTDQRLGEVTEAGEVTEGITEAAHLPTEASQAPEEHPIEVASEPNVSQEPQEQPTTESNEISEGTEGSGEIVTEGEVTEAGVPGEVVTEGAATEATPEASKGTTLLPSEGKPAPAAPGKPEGETVTEFVSAPITEKPEVSPETVEPTATVTEKDRPTLLGEGDHVTEPETIMTTLEYQDKTPEEAYTSPESSTPIAANLSTTERSHELFTSGAAEEEHTKPSVEGELSTSATLFGSSTFGPFTTPTMLTPSHEIPDEHSPDYQAPVEEEDYGEDHGTFGPGTCRYGGKVYVSAQQIPRDDPCDFCFCFRSDIICLQQSCPPPIPRCHEEPIRGFCCPRYECPVSMATSINVTTTTTTTTTTLPPHFLAHAYKGRANKAGCQIQNKAYRVGEEIKSASGPCLHCTCGGDGQMKCDPKACSPEPMLRQMIAAAASSRRRR